jgi:hypothetical protein
VRQLLRHLNNQLKPQKKESNIMPYGKGTYGSKVGRPSKSAKGRKKPMAGKKKKK